MKTKLLRKVRKRYGWYLNKSGFPVLLDHSKKEVSIIDLDFYKTYFKYESIQDVRDSIQVSEQEVCWRLLLTIMLETYGFSYSSRWYRIAVNKSKKHKN
jgi:hypothetical protein